MNKKQRTSNPFPEAAYIKGYEAGVRYLSGKTPVNRWKALAAFKQANGTRYSIYFEDGWNDARDGDSKHYDAAKADEKAARAEKAATKARIEARLKKS